MQELPSAWREDWTSRKMVKTKRWGGGRVTSGHTRPGDISIHSLENFVSVTRAVSLVGMCCYRELSWGKTEHSCSASLVLSKREPARKLFYTKTEIFVVANVEMIKRKQDFAKIFIKHFFHVKCDAGHRLGDCSHILYRLSQMGFIIGKSPR